MKNINNDKLVAVDVDLSGISLDDGSIIRLCIIPLDENCRMTEEKIFDCHVKCELHDSKYITGKAYNASQNMPTNGEDLLDMLFEYKDSFNLKFNKRFTPVCFNWGLVQSHLRHLLMGHFDYFFTWKARDLMVAANHIDDVLFYNGFEYSYQKYDLQYIMRKFGKTSSGGLVWRTKNIADTYREMLTIPKIIGE